MLQQASEALVTRTAHTCLVYMLLWHTMMTFLLAIHTVGVIDRSGVMVLVAQRDATHQLSPRLDVVTANEADPI